MIYYRKSPHLSSSSIIIFSANRRLHTWLPTLLFTLFLRLHPWWGGNSINRAVTYTVYIYRETSFQSKHHIASLLPLLKLISLLYTQPPFTPSRPFFKHSLTVMALESRICWQTGGEKQIIPILGSTEAFLRRCRVQHTHSHTPPVDLQRTVWCFSHRPYTLNMVRLWRSYAWYCPCQNIPEHCSL